MAELVSRQFCVYVMDFLIDELSQSDVVARNVKQGVCVWDI